MADQSNVLAAMCSLSLNPTHDQDSESLPRKFTVNWVIFLGFLLAIHPKYGRKVIIHELQNPYFGFSAFPQSTTSNSHKYAVQFGRNPDDKQHSEFHKLEDAQLPPKMDKSWTIASLDVEFGAAHNITWVQNMGSYSTTTTAELYQFSIKYSDKEL